MMSANINDYALMPLKTVETALADFYCGREDIDDFFHNKALAYEKAMFGKTYAICPNGNPDTIMGAITVANACIFTRHLSWRRRDFIGADIEDEKSGQNYPAILLGRLGVDKRFQHLHLGPQIIDFVKAWFSSESNTGCRFLIVDAYNEAGLIQFYERCGLHLFFSTEEQEKKYRNIHDKEGDPPLKLETRLLFFDLINYNNEQ